MVQNTEHLIDSCSHRHRQENKSEGGNTESSASVVLG
jgi:hypothetical protein